MNARAIGRLRQATRALGWAIFIFVVLLANAGIGGWIGMGAPFVLPLLWLAARHAGAWMNALCIALGGLSGTMTGGWIAWGFGLESDPFATPIAAGCVTVMFFVLTTTSGPRGRSGATTQPGKPYLSGGPG